MWCGPCEADGRKGEGVEMVTVTGIADDVEIQWNWRWIDASKCYILFKRSSVKMYMKNSGILLV